MRSQKTTDPNSEKEPNHTTHVIMLVNQAKAGNKRSFEELMTLFNTDIFRLVFYRTRSRMDAEDLTQEIFTQTFIHIGRLKRPEFFKSWLYAIALNKTRDFIRKKCVRKHLSSLPVLGTIVYGGEEHSKSPDVLSGIISRDFWNRFERHLLKLSRMEREVFILKFLDHLTIKEITEILKKSESTIKTHLYRALMKIKNDAAIRKWLREEMV